jgi:uncharacterized membrane protein YgdD (TMEM256/DUF423 family)
VDLHGATACRAMEIIMRKTFLRLGSLLALIAVALGAFGAHGLRDALASEQLRTFEIGVRYQFYHALALFGVGLLLYWRKVSLLKWAGWLFFAGILLFSGSLYLLSVRELFALPVEWLGPVTPIGGLLFMAAWGVLLFSTYQENQRSYQPRSSQGEENG